MTPAALRAAIASARLRPRMYGATPMHLAGYLHGMIAGAAHEGAAVNAAWSRAYVAANPLRPYDSDVCDAAEATVAALWPFGNASAPAALDLDAIEARITLPTCSRCGAVDPPTEPAENLLGESFERHVDCPKRDPLFGSYVAVHGLPRADQAALVAALRASRAEVAALRANIADGERIAAEVRGLFAHVDDDAPPAEHNPDRAQLAALAAGDASLFDAIERAGVPMPGARYVGSWSRLRYEVVVSLPVRRAVRLRREDGFEHTETLDVLARDYRREDSAAEAGAKFAEQHPEAAAGALGNTSVSRRAAEST